MLTARNTENTEKKVSLIETKNLEFDLCDLCVLCG